MGRILIACEYSGRVRRQFRKHGCDAWSCDFREDVAYSPYHIRGDVRDIINDGWSMMIAFPPCTYLSVVGNRWRKQWEEDGKVDIALDFIQVLMTAPIPHTCIENPIGIISSRIRKPDQIINPYQFGEPWQKTTCLWLNNLPKLKSTKTIKPVGHWVDSGPYARNPHDNGNRAIRDLTFRGIARAMGDQWSKYDR